MRRVDVQVPAADGNSNGTLHVPEGAGPWPGVLVFPDAGGGRETFRQMADRLASMGYVALIPDIYYRAGQWAPFDVATVFTDERERARMSGLASVLTNDRIVADSGAYADFLLARPEVTGPAIGTTGYCLGGRLSLIAAGGLGRKIAAAASFHGGRLAVAGDPSSPHLAAARITAAVYVAGAKDDRLFTHRAGRIAGWRADRRRGRAHDRVLPRPPRVRRARQPDLRCTGGRPALGGARRALPGPPGPPLSARSHC
jgi:carboxymethylenebutenolidase